MLAKQRNQEVKEKSKRNTDFSIRLVELEIKGRHLERHGQGTCACSSLDKKSTRLGKGKRKGKS